MINAIALDDEPLALTVIENFCTKIDYVQLQKAFTQPNEALKFLSKYPVDLLFLDIHMQSMSGIDLYKSIEQNTMVIFTTAYSEYAVDGFNLNAIDYLLKPFTFERFTQAVAKANEYFSFRQNKDGEPAYLFVRADYSLIKIDLEKIELIEGLDDYLKIHIKDKSPVVARMTMKNLIEKLPASKFVRVHRSFILPIRNIEIVRGKTIYLGEREIPIGASFEEAVFSVIKK